MMTYEQAAQWLLTRDNFLILTHKRPDGDTLGSGAALCLALRQQGKTAYLLENVQTTELFTSHLEGKIAPENFVPDTVVAVDIAAVSLVPQNAQCYLEAGIHLAIDHHPSQEFFAQETCLYGERAACGEIIYDIVRQWGDITPDVALPLYVAISTDTGCFLYGNTTADSHRIVANLMDTGIQIRDVNHRHFREKSFPRLQLDSLLIEGMELHQNGHLAVVTLSLDTAEKAGVSEEDLDSVSSLAGSIQGVSIGVTLRELRPDVWKLSLRTNPEELNASDICALMGGGGHAAASGATIRGDLDAVKRQVLDSIVQVQNG